MPIEEYIKKFSILNTYRNSNHWSSTTCQRAPHKPFLLLAVIDQVAQGKIVEIFIEPSFELINTWNGYWVSIMASEKTLSMAYPFFFMKSGGFWHLLSQTGSTLPNHFRTPSVAWFRQNFSGVKLDEDLFVFLLDPQTREQLRSAIIQRYFSLEIQPKLYEQGIVHFESEKYKAEILEPRQIPSDYRQPDIPKKKKYGLLASGWPSSVSMINAVACAAFAFARLMGIQWLRPHTSFPGAKATITIEKKFCLITVRFSLEVMGLL